MNVISIVGNVLVCLAVYKNPQLRSTTNLYIIALAASDLLCATVEMPEASAVLIIRRWNFGDAVCQLQGFLAVFVTNSTPATMGLLVFNRYMRIVKRNHYNKIFSPRKSKVWLSFVGFLSLCICWSVEWQIGARLNSFLVMQFAAFPSPHQKTESFITVSCLVCFLFTVVHRSLRYYKIFLKVHQHDHEVNVAPSLRNSRNQAGRISVQEINISGTLAYVAGGFLLCWILMWAFLLWKRLSPDTAPRIVQLTIVFLFSWAAQ